MESSFLRKRRKKLVVKLYRTRFYMYQRFHKKLDFAGNITDLHCSSLSFPALPYPPAHTPPMLVWYLKIPIATSAHTDMGRVPSATAQGSRLAQDHCWR